VYPGFLFVAFAAIDHLRPGSSWVVVVLVPLAVFVTRIGLDHARRRLGDR
jgi:hypothetical protein